MIKFTDLDLPKVKQETQNDDTFISYFVSADKVPRSINFSIPTINELTGTMETRLVTLPQAYKSKNGGDELDIRLLGNGLVKDLNTKRMFRFTEEYKKRIIREFVIDTKGNTWEIRSGNIKKLETEPEVYISESERMNMVKEEVAKVKVAQEMSVEELERLLAKKRQSSPQKNKTVIDSETGEEIIEEVKKEVTKKSRSEKMKEYWAKKRATEKTT